MQRHSYSTLAQPSANIYQESAEILQNNSIETTEDDNLSKDEQITNLKLYIQEILTEKEQLSQTNAQLKNRISELRKTLKLYIHKHNCIQLTDNK